jgi:hypothetical protein
MGNAILKGTALILLLSMMVACGKVSEKPVAPVFVFNHQVNGNNLQKSALVYTNAAGNNYQVDELQYFISDITIKTSDGTELQVTDDNSVHYVDIDIPATLEWVTSKRLKVGFYDSISFLVGINDAKNKSGLFPNPPERDMFWPEMMGGGYHYIKMNGKWMAANDTLQPFNLHLGMAMDMGSAVHNFVKVTLPLKVQAGTLSNTFTIVMDIEKWFSSPNVWDWNSIGGQIMQNQEAMHKAAENGAFAFRVLHEGKDIIYHD